MKEKRRMRVAEKKEEEIGRLYERNGRERGRYSVQTVPNLACG